MKTPDLHASSHSFLEKNHSYRDIDDMTTLERIDLALFWLERFGSQIFSVPYLINKAKEEKVAPEVVEEIEKRYTHILQNLTLSKINNAMTWLESTKKDIFDVKGNLDEAERENLLAPNAIQAFRKQYEDIINTSQK